MKRFGIIAAYILASIFSSSLFAKDLLWISLENRTNGAIKASVNQGKSWISLGKVIRPGKGVVEGFTACKWGREGTVVAVSSYAIHIKASENEVFSILSKEMETPPKEFGGQPPGSAGILTDIKAGTLIFRDLAPSPGSKVCLRKGDILKELPNPYILQGDEEIFLIVEERELPQGIVIENKVGGSAYVIREGKRVVFARVEKPLTGIGRFDGTEFTGVGRINTVHPGVITVSTVPAGADKLDSNLSGGFQILPLENASQGYFSTSPPYLIIAPLEGNLAGQYPLFDGTIGLGDFGGRGYRVEASWDGVKWEELPLLRGKIDDLASYLSKTFKGKYGGIMKLIGILCPQVDLEEGIREALREKISEEGRIVRGRLEVEVRLQGEGAKVVDLKIDGKLRAVKNFPPFVLSVDTSELTDGEHIIEVSARDENGEVLASQSRKIYVDNEGIFQEKGDKSK